MNLDPIITAAHCPPSIRPRSFGVWHIARHDPVPAQVREWVGFDTMTCLHRLSGRTIHLGNPYEIVMEDSRRELLKHSPIFRRAAGRVLVTGLGLGCVVRGLLAKPQVRHIDVIEIDTGIIRYIGPEFAADPRVTIHAGDALAIDLSGSWDFAWHDLWTDSVDTHLQCLHAKLFVRFQNRTGWQGAWHFPGNLARHLPWNGGSRALALRALSSRRGRLAT